MVSGGKWVFFFSHLKKLSLVIVMGSWIFIHSVFYSQLCSFFILVFRLSKNQPVEDVWSFVVSFLTWHLFVLEHYLIFRHRRRPRLILYFFCLRSALLSSGEQCLESKIWMLKVLTGTRMCASRLCQWMDGDMCICVCCAYVLEIIFLLPIYLYHFYLTLNVFINFWFYVCLKKF